MKKPEQGQVYEVTVGKRKRVYKQIYHPPKPKGRLAIYPEYYDQGITGVSI